MLRAKLYLFSIQVLLFLALLPVSASGEGFIDVYIGQAKIQDDTVSASSQSVSIFGSGPLYSVSRKISYDTSTLSGVRFGGWFEGPSWFGMAGDLSYFEAAGDGVDIDIILMSLLFMGRAPLYASREFPKGRIQPYAALGLTYLYADISVDYRPDIPVKVEGGDDEVVPEFRAGLAWQLNKHIAIFAEFRYLKVDLKAGNDSVFLSGNITEAKAEIKTEQLLGGMSFRF